MLDFLKTLVSVVINKVPDTSPAGTTDKIDWAKSLRNVGFYAAGAAIAELGRQLDLYDAGTIELVIAGVIGFAADYVAKLIKENEKV